MFYTKYWTATLSYQCSYEWYFISSWAGELIAKSYSTNVIRNCLQVTTVEGLHLFSTIKGVASIFYHNEFAFFFYRRERHLVDMQIN